MKLLNLIFSTLANGVALSEKIRIIGGEEVKRFENHSYMASLQDMFEHSIRLIFRFYQYSACIQNFTRNVIYL